MNDGLVDAFRHTAWAMRELFLVCQELTETQLQATAPGTYGSIIATLWHTVSSEAGYCARLTGEELRCDPRNEESPSLDELAGHIDDLAARWDKFLAHPFDAERTFVVKWHDGTDYDVPAGVFLAQALHHGNEHRAQICTVLSSIGVTTPALGVWDHAEATDRATRRETQRTDEQVDGSGGQSETTRGIGRGGQTRTRDPLLGHQRQLRHGSGTADNYACFARLLTPMAQR